MPSNTLACEERADFRALPMRMVFFRVASSSHPRLFIHSAILLRQRLYDSLVLSDNRYCFMPPTLRSIDMLLSLRIISRSLGEEETLLRPSKASPPLIEPSPMTATTCLFLPSILSATAIPNAALMLFEACPQVNVSYSLSCGQGKGCSPPSFLFVENTSRRPVSILCPYAWCPTSHTMRS